MNKQKSLFYGDMKENEKQAFCDIVDTAKRMHFSKEAAKYLKHVIDSGIITDYKEVNDPAAVVGQWIKYNK